MKSGCSPNSPDAEGRTPLHYAVSKGHLEVAAKLIELGADVDRGDSLGKTPLHYAVERGDISLVNLLLERGATPEVQDSFGKTALHYAIEEGNAALVKQFHFLKNIPTREGVYPIHLAVEAGRKDIFKLLVELGADLKVKDNLGKTPLHYAVVGGNGEIVEELLNRGAPLSEADKFGKTPVHYAIANRNTEALRLFFSKVDREAFKGKGLLHEAASLNEAEVLERL